MVNYTDEAIDKITMSVSGIAANLLNATVFAVKRIGGSGNNRVYQLTCDSAHRYVAKFYFRNPIDQRNRLETEFNSFSFLSSQGITNIPRPIAMSLDESCAIYEFIEGTKITPSDIKKEDIQCALSFVADLKRLNKPAFSEDMPAASDACFSIEAVIADVVGRLNRFALLESREPEYRELEYFLNNNFKPFLDHLQQWVPGQCVISNISFGEEIPLEQRTLSPSDFGFHNALRTKDGRIIFLDFEYFGWDDPAKMVVDYLLHPAMGLSEAMKENFISGMLDIFKENSSLAQRVRLVYPLFGMKWCMIFLNEFIANDFSRRVFASANPLDRRQVHQTQLLKSKNLFQKIKDTYEEFPYARG